VGIKAQEVLANSLRRVGCEVARNRHYDGASVQRQRLLSVATAVGAIVTAGVGVMQLVVGGGFGYVGFSTLALPPSTRSSHRCTDLASSSRRSR
jgi:hypothetical protein